MGQLGGVGHHEQACHQDRRGCQDPDGAPALGPGDRGPWGEPDDVRMREERGGQEQDAQGCERGGADLERTPPRCPAPDGNDPSECGHQEERLRPPRRHAQTSRIVDVSEPGVGERPPDRAHQALVLPAGGAALRGHLERAGGTAPRHPEEHADDQASRGPGERAQLALDQEHRHQRERPDLGQDRGGHGQPAGSLPTPDDQGHRHRGQRRRKQIDRQVQEPEQGHGEDHVGDRCRPPPRPAESHCGDDVAENHQPGQVDAGLARVLAPDHLDRPQRHGGVLHGEIAIGPALLGGDLREPGQIGEPRDRGVGLETVEGAHQAGEPGGQRQHHQRQQSQALRRDLPPVGMERGDGRHSGVPTETSPACAATRMAATRVPTPSFM